MRTSYSHIKPGPLVFICSPYRGAPTTEQAITCAETAGFIALFNFKVPLLLNDILGNNPYRDIIKGIIMALDNLIAVVVQPFFGDLSDRTKSRYGRRMPFIIIGTVLAAIFFVWYRHNQDLPCPFWLPALPVSILSRKERRW